MPATSKEQARAEIIAAAKALLDGQIGPIEAARRIASRRHDLDREQEDSDLHGFAGIDSQTDDLLVGADINTWHPSVREEKRKELEEAEEFFRASAHEGAAAILARFGRPA